MTHSAHPAGQAAARDGLPHTACPHPKPSMTSNGEHYPGPWECWMSGWIVQRGWMNLDYEEARAELYDHMTPALKVKGP